MLIPISFFQYYSKNAITQISEKILDVTRSSRFGQIVFLAGGAGSGKGFVVSNILKSDTFKVIDVDVLKKNFLKLAKEKNKYPELRYLDFKNPEDVSKMHVIIQNTGIKNTLLKSLFGASTNPDRLPNILFDVTLKDMDDEHDMLDILNGLGYKPINTHIIWVLSNFITSVSRNRRRARVVYDDILLGTHKGAKKTMMNLIRGYSNQILKKINGYVYVVLNNNENTIWWTDKEGNVIKSTGKHKKGTVKDFTAIKVKDPGKPMTKNKEITDTVEKWVADNAPSDTTTVEDLPPNEEVKEQFSYKKRLKQLLESSDMIVYFDLDGVVADFDAAASKHLGMEPNDSDEFDKAYKNYIEKNNGFFLGMSLMPGAKQMIKNAQNIFGEDNVKFLSATGRIREANVVREKNAWVKKHFGNIPLITVKRSRNKEKYANSNSILVDDRMASITPFKNAGGNTILFKDAASISQKLQRYKTKN